MFMSFTVSIPYRHLINRRLPRFRILFQPSVSIPYRHLINTIHDDGVVLEEEEVSIPYRHLINPAILFIIQMPMKQFYNNV